jgi:hypothetical protein
MHHTNGSLKPKRANDGMSERNLPSFYVCHWDMGWGRWCFVFGIPIIHNIACMKGMEELNLAPIYYLSHFQYLLDGSCCF